MSLRIAVAGAGIAGLATALACLRTIPSVQLTLLERASAFGETGAGIQIGPNVTRILHAWGLERSLADVAAFPERLVVRSAGTGSVLAVMRLGESFRARYGAPYATLHRADLHALLLAALRDQAGSSSSAPTTQLATRVAGIEQDGQGVALMREGQPALRADAAIGADGLWSAVRAALLHDGAPRLTGHLAYRALVAQAALPQALRGTDVTVWLGARMHLVHYPVQRGEALNCVAFLHGRADPGQAAAGWDRNADTATLRAGTAGCCAPLRDLMAAIGAWRMWVMSDRPPVCGAHELALGRVALVGDAAHPMRPYLAQGAGMAIEDAAALGTVLASCRDAGAVPEALRSYADRRWQRNARVQARALRNGRIFHATGPVRLGRDLALRVLGERLLDMPWLYGH